ncbi:hypothetical protein, partial [Cardiobacterium hominis]|uniref:hypothetical protein n=1 Tax=Cardiobacterium hominis TaxID=2718 RepID=UPI001C4E0E80
CQPSFLICFEPQKKHFLCSKPLTPLKALQHKAYSDSWLLFCPIRLAWHGAITLLTLCLSLPEK